MAGIPDSAVLLESGAKTENLKNILLGSSWPLLDAAMPVVTQALAPALELEPALLIVVFAIVFLIIALGDVAHMFFNNYAFVYFTVATIFPKQTTLQWLLVLLLGGAFFTGGILGIIKLATRNKEPQS